MSCRGAVRAGHATIRAAGLLLLFCGAPVAADPIFKCSAPDGSIHYRDTPCPVGTELPAPRVDPGPAYAPRPDTPPGPAAPPANAGNATAPAAPALPIPAPPQLYACERYDGQEQYVTNDPVPRRYQVPLWAVMSDTDRMGAAYTWVEDRCQPMTLGQQCAHWNARRGEIAPRRKLAFKDELAKLDAELAVVRRQLEDYCGG